MVTEDDGTKARDLWLKEGLDKRWIVGFCLNHDSGLFASEMNDDEALERCITAYRIAHHSPTTLL